MTLDGWIRDKHRRRRLINWTTIILCYQQSTEWAEASRCLSNSWADSNPAFLLDRQMVKFKENTALQKDRVTNLPVECGYIEMYSSLFTITTRKKVQKERKEKNLNLTNEKQLEVLQHLIALS